MYKNISREAMSTPRNPETTRQRLIEAAFSEIHEYGFQGMRVDEVLRQSGLRKGAMYHHFGSKYKLGYAVLDEKVGPLIEAAWLMPLADTDDPISALEFLMLSISEEAPLDSIKLGCPLNNIAQEMSAIDEGFRERIVALFEHWIEGISKALERGQQAGTVRSGVNVDNIARFLVSTIEGCFGLAKAQQSKAHLTACREQLTIYLNALRPLV